LFIKRLFLYVICFIASCVILSLVLPYAGIVKAKFLPPTWVYRKADQQVSGRITKTYSVQTNDPFHVGDRIYFWDYTFYAKEIPPGKTKPQLVQYYGEVRVEKESFDKRQENDTVLVRYEKTYPWINGLDNPPIGLGCGEGANILSGWLIWLGVAAVVGFIFLGLVTYFMPKEDL